MILAGCCNPSTFLTCIQEDCVGMRHRHAVVILVSAITLSIFASVCTNIYGRITKAVILLFPNRRNSCRYCTEYVYIYVGDMMYYFCTRGVEGRRAPASDWAQCSSLFPVWQWTACKQLIMLWVSMLGPSHGSRIWGYASHVTHTLRQANYPYFSNPSSCPKNLLVGTSPLWSVSNQ